MLSIIVFFVLLFGLLMGLRRGLVRQVLHLTGFVIAFIVATIFYQKLAGTLSMWIPYPDLSTDSSWALFLKTMPLENAFYNAVSFALIFFLAKIILQTVAYMLDFVANFPVLRSVNKLLGAALGFIEMYLLTFIVLFIMALVPIRFVQEHIDNSFLATFIVKHTPILSKVTESLMFTESLSKIL